MIKYVVGDATVPCVATGTRIIAHVVNNEGAWGAGFVLALSQRWPSSERDYRRWDTDHRYPFNRVLGNILFSPVDDRVFVAHLCAQDGVGFSRSGGIPLQYRALEACLHRLRLETMFDDVTVHMPRIGCGLAGGTWDKVGPLVEKHLDGIDVYVYDLP